MITIPTRLTITRPTKQLCTLAGALTFMAFALAACSDQGAEAETAQAAASSPSAEEAAALSAQFATLQARAQQVQDANDIKKLQRAYGYYMEEGLWDEVANLFADNATLELARDGVYSGKDRIRQYLYALGEGQQGLRQGQLNEQLQVMPVVTLADDGQTAKARWRNILLTAQLGQHAELGEGPFENEYVKENGVWKFSKVRWQPTMINQKSQPRLLMASEPEFVEVLAYMRKITASQKIATHFEVDG
ncbi:MAG: nuclear transport factor 2 family protein, partial [Pseudomonadota bacterium]